MHFEWALNGAWLLLGLVAMAGTLRAIYHDHSPRKRFSTFLQLVGIAAVVLALFPYISASDDVVRIANAAPQRSESGNRPTNSDLVRLYEVVDTAIVSYAAQIAVVFVFFATVAVLTIAAERQSAPLALGRSPPFSYLSLP